MTEQAGQAKRVRTSPAAGAVTPMMAQYLEIKAAYSDCLLFYRMGDFYELFFEDAERASRALGIALTKRGRHNGDDIPMCGVPVHTADDYLQRLIQKGFRVAVCEQTEDPAEAKKRGAKSVVRREVVRLVTPGTLTEESLLDARANNFLTAVFRAPTATADREERFALASLDISTGEFLIGETHAADLAGELVRLAPSEVVMGEELAADAAMRALIEGAGAAATPVPRPYFDSLAGERGLKEKLQVATIEGFGAFTRAELAATAALLKYVDITQLGRQPALRPPKRVGPSTVLVIDAATRASLELVRSTRGERRGTLLQAVDRTVTGAGARELAARLASPLTDPAAIARRLDAVAFLRDDPALRAELRRTLAAAPDIARALARLTLGRGAPRDLGAIRSGLAVAAATAARLAEAADVMGLPERLAALQADLTAVDTALGAELTAALGDELPLQKRDGGFVRQGYRPDLDENRTLRDESRQVLAALQASYAELTGVKSLKVRHNNVLGYFVEVTGTHGDKLLGAPLNETFIHRQTLASAVRFTTTELSETEAKITAAADRALAIELEVFNALVERVGAEERPLGLVAAGLAELDHHCGLAELAEEQGFVRPVVDDDLVFHVEGGRHPVVEQALVATDAGPFVENDCTLGANGGAAGEDGPRGRIWVVTGPNMAGKSTFLRQNALIVVLAQIGAFVPARTAHIGVVDRLFSRVGASDDLAGGRSTFMVEMVETAGILNQATERSFVILDEIGRGTATYDGLSIAWATVEHLHEVNRCRALFATHYHELTALAQKLEHAANATIDVKEWRDEIVFLHKVVPGAADRSYGIQVAKLAGLPRPVIARAGDVLQRLEAGDQHRPAEDLVDDLPLFSAARAEAPPAATAEPSPLAEALKDLHPDDMSPREALEALYRLKALAAETDGES